MQTTFEVVKSDRIALAEQANNLIEILNCRQMSELRLIEYTDNEQLAYNNALTYLANQFKQGYKETSVELVSKEYETPT
jgi:hypothetical protein